MSFVFLPNTNDSPSLTNALIDSTPRQWPPNGSVGLRYENVAGVPITVPHVSRFVDLDGDGADDFLFGLGGGDTARVLLGRSMSGMPLNLPYVCLGANQPVDLDADGDLDLAITEPDTKPYSAGGDYYAPSVEVAENMDGLIFAEGVIADYPTPEPVWNPSVRGQGALSGDFDGDGDVDIITLGDLCLFRNVSGIPHVSPWTRWRQKYGVSNEQTDGDHDRATAAQEYAFGGHPWFADTNPAGATVTRDDSGALPPISLCELRITARAAIGSERSGTGTKQEIPTTRSSPTPCLRRVKRGRAWPLPGKITPPYSGLDSGQNCGIVSP